MTVIRNLGLFVLVCMLILPTAAAVGQAGGAQIGVFEPLEIRPGDVVEVPIRVENADGLYAIDIEMSFDPEILAAEDADPAMDGVQLALGEFLDPGLLLYNTVDNAAGKVRFVMTQANPSEPKSGNGVLLVVYFKGVKAGVSDLTVTKLQTAGDQGIEIPSTPRDSSLTVKEEAAAVQATSIPVADPAEAILIPTAGPSPTPTPQPTATPKPELAVEAQPAAEEQPAGRSPAESEGGKGAGEPSGPDPEAAGGPATTAAGGKNQQQSGFSLAENWWIVAVAAGLVGGMGIYLRRTKTS